MQSMEKTKEMVLSGLGIAVVFVATFLIHIPNGLQGYINCGDGFILLFCSFLSPLSGFMVGGIGSALADIAGGYGSYFLFTLVIKGLEGYFVCRCLMKHNDVASRTITYVLGSTIMIVGYIVADTFVNQSFGLGLLSIPGNLIQALVGIIIASVVYPMIQKQFSKE